MPTLQAYLPQDRRRALARGETLPDRTRGTVLFADISGFTPLTESLRDSLGAQRGAEELTNHLNAVYGALIAEVERRGGSVIGFAGDAITCWFDDPSPHLPSLAGKGAKGDGSEERACACAFALQQAMHSFGAIRLPDGAAVELTLKVIVASGPARRFVVGDPAIQRVDTLAGATIARIAAAEHIVEKGEVLVDDATAQALGETLNIRAWRTDPETGERFGAVERFTGGGVDESPASIETAIPNEVVREWMHHQVYEREVAGQDELLTEFRPCVPLFVRFAGIDYDAPAAEGQFDQFIRMAQTVAQAHGGTLMDITIGDKGSYAYISFGALSTYEDNDRRAVNTALALRAQAAQLGFIAHLEMGITQGTLRVGAYGGATRRVYGALGDDVNLAARLMQTAAPGEILVSHRVQEAITDEFTLEPRPPLPMKGKSDLLPVFAVTGKRKQRATRLPEPAYRLPMIGRQAELQTVDEKLARALAGQGQVIGIVAEAGMGKSRLVAEVIRLARKRGFVGYGGACQSSGTNTPYLVWQNIWQAFFDLDVETPQRKLMRTLEGELEDRAPARVDALPLLGLVLDLPLPDNDFTKALDPKDRKSALEALLEDCLKSAAREAPLLIVLEDLHWVDPLSNELLETLARASAGLPICFVLAYRPPDGVRYQTPRIESSPAFIRIELQDLTAADAEQLIRAKLAQLFPERSGALPQALTAELTRKSQGNPFFIEELLNYLHDRGLNPYDADALNALDLPASLQTLILSRIDQLTEPQKITLKVASVIGRVFPFSWLRGYYPSLGDDEAIRANLAELSNVDLTPLDTPEPELAYLFKHIITQEVAYGSLAYATRAQLHELLARFLELKYPDNPPIEALAFHYSRSDNAEKKREYLRRSGEAAQAAYSNATALEYYQQALALVPDDDEQITLHLNSGVIQQMLGNREETRRHSLQAFELATARGLTKRLAECEVKLGNGWLWDSDYSQALAWLDKARAHAAQSDDVVGTCDALGEIGIIHWRLGNFDQSQQYLEESLALARQLGDKKKQSYVLSVIAQVSAQVGRLAESHPIFDESVALAREINDKRRIAGTLTNYGTTYYYEGNYDQAEAVLAEGLAAARVIGDKRLTSILLNNYGNIFYARNDFETARRHYEEALAIGRAADDKYTTSVALSSLGITAFRQGRLMEADLHYQEGLRLNREMGDKTGLALMHCYLGLLALAQGQPGAARAAFAEGLTIAHQSDMKTYLIYNLIGLACVFLTADDPARAVRLLAAAAALANATGLKIESELQEPYDAALAEAREKLSAADFQSAWERGEKMPPAEAVQFARGDG